MTRPVLATTTELRDAVFLDIECDEVAPRYDNTAHAAPPSQLALLRTRRAATEIRPRAGSYCCLLVSLADPQRRYLCAPLSPELVLPCFAPLLTYRVTLEPTNVTPTPQQVPATVAEARAAALVPEWVVATRPTVSGNLCGTSDWTLSYTDLVAHMTTVDWMRDQYIIMTTDADGDAEVEFRNQSVWRSTGAFDAVRTPPCAASQSAADRRGMLCAQLSAVAPLPVAQALSLRSGSDEVAAECGAALQCADPVRLYMEHVTDSVPECEERYGYNTVQMHALAQLYSQIASACLHYDAAITMPQRSDSVDALLQLGMLRRCDPISSAVLPASVARRAECLASFVRWLQTTRPCTSPPAPFASLDTALATRDVLMVQTDVPMLADEVGMAPPACLATLIDAAAAVLVPLRPAPDVCALQQQFATAMAACVGDNAACIPLVVVLDVQLWSPQSLWFWLGALLHTTQSGPGFAQHADGRFVATGSCAPFKLLFTYSQLSDDAGLCAIVHDMCAPLYLMQCTGAGFPGPLMSSIGPESNAAQRLLYKLARRRALGVAPDAVPLHEELAAEHQCPHTVELPTSHVASRDQLNPAIPIVDGTLNQTALRQLRRHQLWPQRLPLPDGVVAEAQMQRIDVVAITAPVVEPHLALLVCMMAKVVIVLPEQ